MEVIEVRLRPAPGRLVKEVRLKHGLSQKQLADRAGTTQSAISRIEHDQLSPTVDTLDTLLRAMGERLELSADGHDFALEHSG